MVNAVIIYLPMTAESKGSQGQSSTKQGDRDPRFYHVPVPPFSKGTSISDLVKRTPQVKNPAANEAVIGRKTE
ncbi:MAG TPA: hypothetical protein VF189_05080 [Patescibacteria group bacterium]